MSRKARMRTIQKKIHAAIDNLERMDCLGTDRQPITTSKVLKYLVHALPDAEKLAHDEISIGGEPITLTTWQQRKDWTIYSVTVATSKSHERLSLREIERMLRSGLADKPTVIIALGRERSSLTVRITGHERPNPDGDFRLVKVDKKGTIGEHTFRVNDARAGRLQFQIKIPIPPRAAMIAGRR